MDQIKGLYIGKRLEIQFHLNVQLLEFREELANSEMNEGETRACSVFFYVYTIRMITCILIVLPNFNV